MPGDSLYRVAADDSGRLLATREQERLIHLFTPGQQQPVSFPKPKGPPELEYRYQVASLEFLPNGRDALVYMTSSVKVTTGRDRGPSWSTAAYRIALDGKSDAELLFLGRARLIRGSDGERVALMLDVWKPRSLGLMRWRYGDEKTDFRTVPWPENEALETFFLNRAGELIELRGRDKLLEIWRHSPKGGATTSAWTSPRSRSARRCGAEGRRGRARP